MAQRIIAIELSGGCVRAAIAERNYKNFEVVDFQEQERIDGESDLGGALDRIVTKCGRSDIAISSIPGEFVAKRVLALPFTDRRRLEQVVPFALEEHLPFAVDDAAVAFTRVGRDDSSTLVIAAAARREVVRDHLNLMARAGLDPKIVTLSTLALAAMLTRVHNGSGGAHLVVDIESGCTSMVLVDAAGTPRAMRTITYGAEVQPGVIPVSTTHAIFAAARQTMLAHGGEARPELVLAGSAAEVPGACELVARALQTPVRDVGAFDYSAMIRSSRTIPKRFTGCIAMLLAEAPANPAELINFRQGELAFHGRSGAPAPLRVPMMLAAAAAGAAVVQFALGIGVSARQLDLLDRQITAITAPALGNPDPATAAAALQAKIAEMTKRLHLMGGSLGHGSPLEVLNVLSRTLPPGLAAEITTLQIDDSGLKLEGEADSFTAVDQVKRSLEHNGQFGQVQLDHAAAASDSGKVEFHLSATAGN